jgi:hypothetical protein
MLCAQGITYSQRRLLIPESCNFLHSPEAFHWALETMVLQQYCRLLLRAILVVGYSYGPHRSFLVSARQFQDIAFN